MNTATTAKELEETIRRVRPQCKSIKKYEGGDNRDVFVVDGTEAFRFPKNDTGVAIGRYEFRVLQLIEGRLSVKVPLPIELAPDGSYNVLSFLQGKVLRKHEVARLPFEKRKDLGLAIASIMNELNSKVTKEEVAAIQPSQNLARSIDRRDDYYAAVYKTAEQQDTDYAVAYRKYFQQLQQVRPEGSAKNIIVFGDFSSPNLVLSGNDELKGVIDWTEFGMGDVHNELRPVFSVIGEKAFEEMIVAIESSLRTINPGLVRLLAVVHELSILITGKQTGQLTPERTRLAVDSLGQWLGDDWTS